MKGDLIGRSRRAAAKREKELRQRFLSSEDAAEHDDRAGLSLQARIVSGNGEEKDWTAESAKWRNAAAPEQGQIFFPSILYLSRWSSNLRWGYCHRTHRLP